jgi:hypothetical protein
MAKPNETTPAEGEEQETEETTPPAKGAEETTEETTEAPEGAEKPDAVKKALDAERNAAREARAQVRDLQAQLATATETIATLTGERDEVTGKVSELTGELTDLRPRVLQYEVAADLGLDLTLATRLRGETRDEMVSDAEDFIAKLGSGADFDGGARRSAPTQDPPEKAHGTFIARLLRGEDPHGDD